MCNGAVSGAVHAAEGGRLRLAADLAGRRRPRRGPGRTEADGGAADAPAGAYMSRDCFYICC
eukprot:COSAG06_NODE_8625_length_2112_cov_1.090909_1_plen_62_part_00